VAVEAVDGRLLRFRGVPAVAFHATPAAAVAALAGQGYDVARRDHWIGEAPAGGPRSAARVLAAAESGHRVEVDYAAPPGGGLLVAAITFDPGWRGRAGGRAVPLHPTALGQVGAVLPPGEGRLVLEYRDRWLPLGAAVSAVGLTALLTLIVLPPLLLGRGRGSALTAAARQAASAHLSAALSSGRQIRRLRLECLPLPRRSDAYSLFLQAAAFAAGRAATPAVARMVAAPARAKAGGAVLRHGVGWALVDEPAGRRRMDGAAG
jgi:hypothetical protein